MRRKRLATLAVSVLAAGCAIAGGIIASESTAEADVASTHAQLPASVAFGDSRISPYLDDISTRLATAEIEVLEVTTKSVSSAMTAVVNDGSSPEDVLPLVVVKVPLSTLQGGDGMLTLEAIRRQVVYSMRDGSPVKFLAIVGIDDEGNAAAPDLSYVGDYVPSADWNKPAMQSISASRDMIATRVAAAAKATGLMVRSTEVAESPDGRTVTVRAIWSPAGDARPGELSNLANVAMLEANRDDGMKVATLIVEIDDDGEFPVARYVFDYALGAMISGSWVSPTIADRAAFDAEWMK